jgi:predicted acylesterase/phospholipase RssA
MDAPGRACDVVMKGGVTSGVVYPLAVCELARAYRFRRIGGTSAGAIAAAATAAAELGRRRGRGGRFAELAGLPGFLERELLSLFQPAPEARPAFRVLLACLAREPLPQKAARVLATLLLAGLPWTVGGGVLALLLTLGLAAVLRSQAAWPGLALAWLGFAALLAPAAALAGLVLRTRRALLGNGYGLCGGLRQGRAAPPALTDWLTELFDRLAGQRPEDGPLAFRDLWGRADAHPEERAIDLEVMTTNLAHGRPYRIPLETAVFRWRPSEFRRLFPERVVLAMLARSPAPPPDDPDAPRPLPAPGELPLVVAVRMSLSFPLLLSAVPLWAVDWSLPENRLAKRAGHAPRPERCWFSDGGIGSNFPIHFFDALLPGCPTFGINLRPFGPGRPKHAGEEARNVRFPRTAGQEVLPDWRRFDGVLGFLLAILDTMQNWVDRTQVKLPGYRDRVVHVHYDADEGGMNLEMPREVVRALVERGRIAGERLRDQFDWDRHRWTRYRTAMARMQEAARQMQRAWSGDGASEGFEAFVARYGGSSSYPLPQMALDASADLMQVASSWDDEGIDYARDAPRPEPELRIRPRV